MIVRSINIRREGDYGGYQAPDASKPYRATIEVTGSYGKVELLLDAAMTTRVMAIIADEVAAAGRKTAEAMTADVFTVPAIAGAK